MGAKIGVLLNCGQQSQFSKVRREFDAGRVNLDPPMTCADWLVPGNLTLLHPQTAYTRKPLHLSRFFYTRKPHTRVNRYNGSPLLGARSRHKKEGSRRRHMAKHLQRRHEEMGASWHGARRIASDRDRWRLLVARCSERNRRT